jgi:prepilin-type N-terminal cleavage/methylation domain-containing protein
MNLVKISKKQKGFTLLELLVSIFIFIVALLAASIVFARTMQAYRVSSNIQKNLESAQFALNLMAKNIRQDTIEVPSSQGEATEIRVYDVTTDTCIGYNFNSTNKTLETGTKNGDCGSPPLYSPAANYVYSGKFFVTPMQTATAPYQIGHVTIFMQMCSNLNCISADEHALQTSVSQRNFSQ